MQTKQYEEIAAVEWLRPQVNTLRERLKTKWGEADSEQRVMHFDIQREEELFSGWDDEEFGKGKGLDYFVEQSGGIDLIIGGPPCQAYSVAGRVRDENGMRDDYRNYLFEHYLNVVNRYRPKFFVFENVPGILSAAPDGTPITELITRGFGLFQKKDTGEWMTGSPQKPEVLSEEQALEVGKTIRDALIKGVDIINNATLDSLSDFEKLDDDLKLGIGEQYYNLAWFHKYFSLICPGKLSGFHSNDWQTHVLRCLRINPNEKYYARSAQLAKIENYAGMYYREFFAVVFEEFGGIKHFVRIGTKDDEKNYAAEWQQKSVVGIGWRAIGSLGDYVAGDGIDKDAITEKMMEEYFHDDKKTASRKAGELARFYKTNSDTVFVAMNGEKLIAFVDEIGEYFYDPSTAMAHMKVGKWHKKFADGDTLPDKSEGKLTSCYQLTNNENLMFLYEKYYYGEESESEWVLNSWICAMRCMCSVSTSRKA